MVLKDRGKKGWGRFFRSFKYASRGLIYVLLKEQNMQLHTAFAVFVVVIAFLLRIPLLHLVILVVVIAGVLALEIVNTAIERTVDLVTNEYHPLAERAKDISAAAVFVFSIAAVVIGILIFYGPVLSLFTK
ncbi:diacylglycerol kinase family protein [Alteribacillus bidgolensis]|uniref:Undecaprenol kinase n=1 Tax=Alteribacillus bidgolensis TaxID=930129 RepID=A0A1G8NZW6_9BACI|nr:diacylglycerol kinase family protein [Alteribacillus bidgolensis]SDI85802.1 undecaprenol kinase [Alteribacillus bidgolensis]